MKNRRRAAHRMIRPTQAAAATKAHEKNNSVLVLYLQSKRPRSSGTPATVEASSVPWPAQYVNLNLLFSFRFFFSFASTDDDRNEIFSHHRAVLENLSVAAPFSESEKLVLRSR
jgi:hypothetical protein